MKAASQAVSTLPRVETESNFNGSVFFWLATRRFNKVVCAFSHSSGCSHSVFTM